MIRRNGNGLTLVAAINRAICEFRRQRRVQWITVGGGGDFAADAGAEAQLAPFPRAKRDIAQADSVGAREILERIGWLRLPTSQAG